MVEWSKVLIFLRSDKFEFSSCGFGIRTESPPPQKKSLLSCVTGMAVSGATAIAEIQFGDYIFPAFDQVLI